MNLKCVNCGTVYRDRWDARTSPTCPTCNISHCSCVDAVIKGPTKVWFRTYPRLDKVLEIDGYWEPYYILQRISEQREDIDLVIAHRIGLRLLGKPVSKINWQLVLRSLILDTERKHKKELSPHESQKRLATLRMDNGIEKRIVLADEIARLRVEWRAQQHRRYSVGDLVDVVNDLHLHTDASATERRRYMALKNRLKTFRKRLKQRSLGSTYSTGGKQ